MKMKTIIRTIIVALGLAATLLGLSACAGGDANAAQNFIGHWVVVEVSDGGETLKGEDLESMKELGLEAYLELNEDKTAAISVFGEEVEGTWEAKSADMAVLTADGESLEMRLADGRISIEMEGSKIVFVKGDPTTVSSSSGAQGATDSSVIDEGNSGRLELAFMNLPLPEGWEYNDERSDDYQIYIQDSTDADRVFQFNIESSTAQECMEKDMDFWGDNRTRLEDKIYGFDTYLAAEFEWNSKPSLVLYIDRPGYAGESIKINCFEIDPDDPIIMEMLQWVRYF